MRLTCPNCGAQYEVPDDVIPDEGRDVQCSNCGDTWYQVHPSVLTAASDADPDDTDMSEDEIAEADAFFDDDEDSTGWEDDEDEIAEDEEYAHSEAAEPESAGRDLDTSISDILKEEAEREAQLRAAEAGPGGLESQAEMGLEGSMDDEQARRARQAQDRMARIRGEDPTQAALAEAGSRRGLLPDIEEINSTLRAASDKGGDTEAPTAEDMAPPPRKGSFARGFALVILFAAVLTLIYANAPRIAQAVPQADPMLSAYVALVDQGRVWLDAQVQVLLPQ